MAYTQFNGWNIIPMPASPAAKQIDFVMHDAAGVTRSPFTRQSQIQAWPGADFWELNFSLPPLSNRVADQWIAWLAALRGSANVFQIGDPTKAAPCGSPHGNPVVDGAQNAMATILNVRGWQASTFRLLMPGDHLEIGYRLHMVAGVTPVNSDAGGRSAIEIWPSLREAVTDGQQITLAKPKGLFRLLDNAREWSRRPKIVTIAFKATEAR